MHKMVRLSLVSLATVCAACASAGSYSQPPWMNFFVSPAPTYSASRERHHSRHSRVAHNHSPVRGSAVTTVSAGSVPDDKPAPAPVVASNAPVTLSLAGDGMDRTRAQQLLVRVDSRLERVHSQKLSRFRKRPTSAPASSPAARAARWLTTTAPPPRAWRPKLRLWRPDWAVPSSKCFLRTGFRPMSSELSHIRANRYHLVLMASDEEILPQLLKLPAAERARLATELVLSLDESQDPDAAQAWLVELDRRARDVIGGGATLDDWVEVRQRIESRLRAR